MSNDEYIYKKFKDHIIEKIIDDKENNVHIIKFGKKVNNKWDWNGLIKFAIIGNQLIVTGDYGEAIYGIYGSTPLSFEMLSKTSYDYLEEKCEASQIGKSFVEWSKDEIIESVNNWISQRAQKDYESEENGYIFVDQEGNAPFQIDWDSLTWEQKEEFISKSGFLKDLDSINDIYSECENKNDFAAFLRTYPYVSDIFGDDYWELIESGTVTHTRCKHHQIALYKVYKLLSK